MGRMVMREKQEKNTPAGKKGGVNLPGYRVELEMSGS
jgi:hypothetical protein